MNISMQQKSRYKSKPDYRKQEKVISQEPKECYYCHGKNNLKREPVTNVIDERWICPDCSDEQWAKSLVTEFPYLLTSDKPHAKNIRSILHIN